MQKIKTILMVIAAIILGLMIGIVAVANATEVTFENCEPETWVGGVKWEWKDGIRGNYSGSTYKDIPEIELKTVGSVVVDLEPGDYAITHYRPAMYGQTADGRTYFMPAKIVEFMEIEVNNSPATYAFGCEE